MKKCPDGKFYNEKTKRCNKIKPVKKQKVRIARKTKPKKSPKKPSVPKNVEPSKPILKKRKRCPNGTRRNPKTKLCEKAKTKAKKSTPKPVTKKTRKRCPNGTRKDPKTGNCVPKNKTKSPKKKLKIVQKLGKKHKITIKVKKLGKLKLKQTRKRCPNGTRKDPKTGKCKPYSRV